MAKGYYVFRGESPHAPFDLVAYKEGKCYRVEVKTVTAGKWLNIGTPANDEWDILIGVDFKNNMVFEFEQGTSRKQMIAEMRAAYGMSPSIRS
jgi:predicted HTH transcriptional regulator